jgi:hypothetical protein
MRLTHAVARTASSKQPAAYLLKRRRPALFYHPNAYYVGVSDIAAAWLVCIAVGILGFVSSVAIVKRYETAQPAYHSAPVPATEHLVLCAVPGVYILNDRLVTGNHSAGAGARRGFCRPGSGISASRVA